MHKQRLKYFIRKQAFVLCQEGISMLGSHADRRSESTTDWQHLVSQAFAPETLQVRMVDILAAPSPGHAQTDEWDRSRRCGRASQRSI